LRLDAKALARELKARKMKEESGDAG